MRRTADKLLTRSRLQERSLFSFIHGYDCDTVTLALPERLNPNVTDRPTRSIRESDLPAIAECLLSYIGWCPPVMSTVWEARIVGQNTLPFKTKQTSTTLVQGWDVAMIYRLNEVSKD